MDYVINIEDVPYLENKILFFYFPELIFLKKFKKMISSLEENCDLSFFAINIKNDKSLKKRFNLVSVPTVIVFKNFKEKNRCEGLVSLKDLKKIIYS